MRQTILIQRIEAAALFMASAYLYWHFNYNFLYFIFGFLAIDLFMIGYIFNSKFGAYTYNAGHSLIIPSLLAVAGAATESRTLIGLCLIWFAHIGMDRALGFGLKNQTGFKHTHLGDIGKIK